MADQPAQPPKLLDQVRTAIRLRRMSYQTEKAYVDWIKRFIVFHNKRHPKEMGAPEIREPRASGQRSQRRGLDAEPGIARAVVPLPRGLADRTAAIGRSATGEERAASAGRLHGRRGTGDPGEAAREEAVDGEPALRHGNAAERVVKAAREGH